MARCPGCNEPVSQFAAGCAVCGADLEAARATARRPFRIADHVPSVGDDALWLAVVALLVLAMPTIGGLLALYGVYAAKLTSQNRTRWGFIALAVLAVALLAVPATRYGVLWALSG